MTIPLLHAEKNAREKTSANDYCKEVTNTNLDTKPSGKNEMNFIRKVMPKMFAICSAFISLHSVSFL